MDLGQIQSHHQPCASRHLIWLLLMAQMPPTTLTSEPPLPMWEETVRLVVQVSSVSKTAWWTGDDPVATRPRWKETTRLTCGNEQSWPNGKPVREEVSRQTTPFSSHFVLVSAFSVELPVTGTLSSAAVLRHRRRTRRKTQKPILPHVCPFRPRMMRPSSTSP